MNEWSERTVDADDHELATQLATEAGELLLGVRVEGLEGAELKDEGDRRANEHLLARLAELRPDDAVLSEESADSPARLDASRVWIIDPLDGTREFSEGDRTDWAVHVALVVDGELAAGAVALPAQGTTLSTAAPPPTPAPSHGPVRLLVSRTRPSAHAGALAADLGAELVPMGSAGAKAMAVVTGAADVYAHSGGQYEWDSAAPVAVAAAAGLHVSRLDGSPLRYNQPDPWLPDLLVCRPDLVDAVVAALGRVGVPTTTRSPQGVSPPGREGSWRAMPSPAASSTGTPDSVYNLLLLAQQALEDCLRYRGFAEDARREGDDELAAWLEELGDSDEEIAERAKAMLKTRL